MNKLFYLFMLLALPLLSVVAVSCDDDEAVEQIPAPTISSVLPAEALPGTVVTITGTNMMEVDRVQFGAMDAENFNAANNTATSVTATVPMGIAPGAQMITISSAGGTDTHNFMVLDAQAFVPTFTSFSPAEGPVGTEVTLNGTNLTADKIASVSLGSMQIGSFTPAATGATITFVVPEGAQSGPITVTPLEGDPMVSNADFVVIVVEEPKALVSYPDIVVNAQGNRNDEGIVTAFSAEGQTFTLAAGKDPEVSPLIDFISADSGGDDELDLFSPSHDSWLPGNYFEDSDDQPVVWPVLNQTKMMIVEGMDATGFDNITKEELEAMSVGDDFKTRISTPDPGVVILFETADNKKGLVLWKAHDPNTDAGSKADIFTFDIKVLE